MIFSIRNLTDTFGSEPNVSADKEGAIVRRVKQVMGTVISKSIKMYMGTLFLAAGILSGTASVRAAESVTDAEGGVMIGGGYAVTGQLEDVGYSSQIFDASNGLPTSDANYILASRDGYIWIGGYSGIIRYDGNVFERQDASGGLTSGRVMFEDSRGRIWVGTNDNGIVLIDDDKNIRFTYREGLPSSSIRSFAEDADGNVFIGSTGGITYADADLKLHKLDDERINDKIIIRLESDKNGRIYGNTKDGLVFAIDSGKITEAYSGDELGTGLITMVYPDQNEDNKVYFGTESDKIYAGRFGATEDHMKEIPIAPAGDVYWITSACNRIWITSENYAGYLDSNDSFHILKNVPMNNSIDMMTSDYQGNLWFASSRQGVMKVVTNNFLDVSREAGFDDTTVNATCFHDDNLYIGTDRGLRILNDVRKPVENTVTSMLNGVRIRCIMEDTEGNLWISTFTNGLGLVCLTRPGAIISYTEKEGLINSQTRCTGFAADGSVIVGTNGGISIIKDGKVARNIGAEDGMSNTVILTVQEGDNGEIYAGTDGDGIYVIKGSEFSKIGRDQGLTSDVILKIKKDEKSGVYWVITSNSIEYIKDGTLHNVTSFPYNNNFDIYSDANDNLWVLSSYGVYSVKASDMINDTIKDYRLYTVANGLTGTPTANAYSTLDENGDLYIAARNGVSKVNINHYFEKASRIKTKIRSVICNDEEIKPDSSGQYVIPAVRGRIQITPAVLDYTMTNPTIRVYLDGSNDTGITTQLSRLSTLEYMGLGYGKYQLHIQVLDQSNADVLQDDIYYIEKKPRMLELPAVRGLMIVLVAAMAGFIVWRIMKNTIIRRQYDEIRQARDEAQRANSAKTRFLANMSHEIRTPINTIMGMDEMILREDPTDVPKGYFMSIINYALDIRNASESLLGLINDLLDMSKIESGKMNLVEQEYDTEDLMRSIVKMIRVRSREKDLFFDVNIDETLPRRLYGDAGKIKQVVLNLLTNAVKYTETGGFSLKVQVEKQDEKKCSLKISVKDTGIGIRSEDMDKLFTAYERLDEEKNSGIQGTGLGLDISRRFAELMGGRLWCESVYGEGSEFFLTVDQGVVDAQATGQFSEDSQDEMKGPYVPQFLAPDAKVLVVDDNPMNLTVISSLLKTTKVSVTTAPGGRECLEKLDEESFNVVLLDHMMPGMDGLETVARIREKFPDLPVYALTANATSGGEEFYISKGFDGYLAKPVDSMTLEKAIMKHLPEEMMQKPTLADAVEDLKDLPDDMQWVKEVEGISVPEGIKHSGGVTAFIGSLKLFFDTIDDSAKVIENAYNEGDLKLYTIKVHALKSTARIVGAEELSELARQLEDAGNSEDHDFIDANTGKLLEDYRAYGSKLSQLNRSDDNEDKEPIPEDELSGAYEALREVIPQMDYDSVEMILEQLKEYRLPKEDAEKIAELEKLLKKFDWDAMEKLIV